MESARPNTHTAMAMSDYVTEFKSLRRPRDGRLLFGVCRSLADRFGTEVVAIRIGVVLAAAVIDYVPLAYIVAVLFIPSVEKVTGGRRSTSRQRGRIRQLFLFALLAGVSDMVIDDSLPSSRSFALLLVFVGIALMNLRSRSLRSSLAPANMEWSTSPGGWAAESDDLPPRWGLAGETINPQLWTGGSGAASDASTSNQSRWHSQFGNFALVALVSVLAIGLWSNTSDHSPLRRAAMLERLAAGSVKITDIADLEELASTPLGDGSFTIDMTDFEGTDSSRAPISIEMGSGRLDIVLGGGTQVTGSVKQAEPLGNVVVRTPETTTGAGAISLTTANRSSDGSADRRSTSQPRFAVLVSISNGLVCFRERDQVDHCGATPS